MQHYHHSNPKAKKPCQGCRSPTFGDALFCYLCSHEKLDSARIFVPAKAMVRL